MTIPRRSSFIDPEIYESSRNPIPRGRDFSSIHGFLLRGQWWGRWLDLLSMLSFGHFCACSKFCLFVTRVHSMFTVVKVFDKCFSHSPSVSSFICSLVICFVCDGAFVFLLQILVFIFTSHSFIFSSIFPVTNSGFILAGLSSA